MSTSNRRTVLLATESVADAVLLRGCLAEIECEVVIAADSRAAQDYIALSPPDVVVVGATLPSCSGFEICRRIKGDPRTSAIMVLMVTALSERADIERAVQAGIDDFLSIPVRKDAFLTRIRNMLKLRSLLT